MRDALAKYAILVALVVLAAVALASCDTTHTITAECLYPDSIVPVDGKIITYWPEGCP